MSLLRAFIALEIPSALQTAIESQTATLRQAAGTSGVRWVSARNLHLTLKFLGDVAPSAVPLLEQMLAGEAARVQAFSVEIEGLGSFPDSHRPRVIWVGMRAPSQLEALQRGVEAGAARLGYPEDGRPFSPHLTIGRVRQGISSAEQRSLRAALESTGMGSIGRATIHSITLFKSDLQPSGPVYSRLSAAPLGGAAEPRGES